MNAIEFEKRQRYEPQNGRAEVIAVQNPVRESEHGCQVNELLEPLPAPSKSANRPIVAGESQRHKYQKGNPAGPHPGLADVGKDVSKIAFSHQEEHEMEEPIAKGRDAEITPSLHQP